MSRIRPTCEDDDHHDAEHAVSRRAFLKGATAASIGLLGGSLGLPDFTLADSGGKTLVKVVMNGGADSLSLCPMHGDSYFYSVRPNIAIAVPSSSDAASAIRLNDMYGLNPNLADLMEIWDAGRLAISPATHFSEGNRSHFSCQRWIGLGTSTDLTGGGCLSRVLALSQGNSVFRGLNAGISASTFLEGSVVVPAIADPASFTVDAAVAQDLAAVVERVEGTAVEKLGRSRMKAMLEAIDVVQSASAGYVTNAGGLEYSATPLGRGLKLIAQLLKKGVPVEIACASWTGSWDTHSIQVSGSVINQANAHAKALKTGATDLLTFWRDLGALRENVLVIIGSEFGRTVKENGSQGTDHGRGGAWMAFGGPTAGGIYNPVASLSTVGDYLPIRLNYKDMLGEALVRHMGMPENLLQQIFPGHSFVNESMFTRSI